MGRVFLGLVLLPAAMLTLWYGMPPVKAVMESTMSTWGAAVGLSGFALVIADLMPVIVPVVCFAGMIAGIIGLAKGRGNV